MLAASQMGGQVLATVRLAINHLGTCQADKDFAHMALHSVVPILETWEKTWAIEPTPAILSENSKIMISYYTVANRLRVAELRLELQDPSLGDPLIGPDGVLHHNLAVLRHVVHKVVPTRVFAFAPDLVLLQCAGIGSSLIKVSCSSGFTHPAFAYVLVCSTCLALDEDAICSADRVGDSAGRLADSLSNSYWR
jgi:hypothetical protein